ncbi:MAG: Fe-S protein assembly co-chaperone HscB [Bacteroidetes bacterium]|jgi:molecular chaperone HscB|nr:Fe-S protein assembly co-chaperone HscB [Bacteroidota bacterium]
MNYFELFELPLQFEVDAKKIRPKFLELSRRFHPDFHSQENEVNQQKVMEQSALINKGWQVFQEPLATLHYVLQLLGKIKEQENPVLSADFLMEMMELNERLTEGDQDQQLQLKEEINRYEKELYEGIKSILKSPPTVVTDTDLEKIKEYYYQQKYLNRIQERIQLNLS